MPPPLLFAIAWHVQCELSLTWFQTVLGVLMTPTSYLLERFWAYARERGDKPKPVWAVISMGGQQPVGYVIGFSVNKRDAEKRMDALENAGRWRLQRLKYAP